MRRQSGIYEWQLKEAKAEDDSKIKVVLGKFQPTTRVTVFDEGRVVVDEVLGIGHFHLGSDLSRVTGLPLPIAEDIVMKHGIVPEWRDGEIKIDEWAIKERDASDVLTARADELCDYVNSTVDGYDFMIYLDGVYVKNLADCMERVTGRPVAILNGPQL